MHKPEIPYKHTSSDESLRDDFAGKALMGLLAYPDGGPVGNTMEEHCEHIATISYMYADAMLAARKEPAF